MPIERRIELVAVSQVAVRAATRDAPSNLYLIDVANQPGGTIHRSALGCRCGPSYPEFALARQRVGVRPVIGCPA